MTYDEVISELNSIASWDVDNGPRGEKKRKAIYIACRAVELFEQFYYMMKEHSDEDGEHHTERSE